MNRLHRPLLLVAALAAALVSAAPAAAQDRIKVGPGIYAQAVGGGDADAAGDEAESQALRRLGQRIVGGAPTDIGRHPWQTSINANPAEFLGNGFERHICGGSLITPTLVVTAAHCFYDVLGPIANPSDPPGFDSPALYSNISGRTVLSGGGGFESDLVDYFIFVDDNGTPGDDTDDFPLYNPSTSEWDVVVLQLATPAAPPAAPIKIAGPGEEATWAGGQPAFVSGWGATSEGGDGSDTLLDARVQMLDDGTCVNLYSASPVGPVLPETQVCAGLIEGGIDACQGDSGGPLTVPISGGGFRLVGDTSFGEGCARPERPGVYGRLGQDPVRGSIAALAQAVAGTNVLGSGAKPLRTPNTKLSKKPKKTIKTKKRKVRVKFVFKNDEPSAESTCKLDKKETSPCTSPFTAKVKRGKHKFTVRSTNFIGDSDPTPVNYKFKVKKKKKRKR